jgi:hypothetical protein
MTRSGKLICLQLDSVDWCWILALLAVELNLSTTS